MNEISGYSSSDNSEPMEESSSPRPSSSSKPAPPRSNAGYKYYDFVPLRLSESERVLLNVLENALEVCEYTDTVDVTFSHTRKTKFSRILESLIDVLSISCGLIMANSLTKGENLLMNKSLNDNVPLFTDLFEIGRRYKIMNPSKMRGTYGKLMYILMDTESYAIKSELKFSVVKPIQTVVSFLLAKVGDKDEVEDMIKDPLWAAATQTISEHSTGSARMGTEDTLGPDLKTKKELAVLSANKKQASEMLVKKYASEALSESDIIRVIDSISDNEAYLNFNMSPVERMLSILVDSFDPNKAQDPFSLKLSARERGPKQKSSSMFGSGFRLYGGYSSGFLGGGSMLSHDHATQFRFVLQTFTLWREVMRNMSKLWLLADCDMVSESYRLVDTGQGYQRLQSSPRIRKEMSRILSLVQQRCGSWVGLSVVHLGDRDVPNALIFIDKYTQVSRILTPIVQCIEQLPNLVQDPAFHSYVSQEWGSIGGLRLQVLSDFFKHGFDGSGDDGGSCIDGRLTSAWNWCSKLHKKPYYYVFMFTGFQGFDGDWKEN